MSQTAVDCVIPTHGRPQYLREALESVLRQTRAPARVTVVSDDNNAESRAVVAELGRAHGGLDLVFLDREPGAPGASASRNLGAEVGGSPLLAFLDDDDLWAPTYLERAVAQLSEAQVDAAVTATQKFSPAGLAPPKVPISALDARGVFRNNPGVTGSNIVVTSRAFRTVGGFDPALSVQNDRDFFLRLLAAGASYVVEPEPLVKVRQHAHGRLTDATTQRADGIMAFDAKHGPSFSWWDRRTMRYSSHYTRMSAASSRSAFVRSAFAALVNWSPTVARDLPLNLFQFDRLRKLVKEMASGAW